jgi:hypothetical protein
MLAVLFVSFVTADRSFSIQNRPRYGKSEGVSDSLKARRVGYRQGRKAYFSTLLRCGRNDFFLLDGGHEGVAEPRLRLKADPPPSAKDDNKKQKLDAKCKCTN